MEKHRLTISVTGGELLGFGNACPYNPDGYKGSSTNTYYGRALAAVRAGRSGKVELTVMDEDGNLYLYKFDLH